LLLLLLLLLVFISLLFFVLLLLFLSLLCNKSAFRLFPLRNLKAKIASKREKNETNTLRCERNDDEVLMKKKKN
jgi:hypothetical protein